MIGCWRGAAAIAALTPASTCWISTSTFLQPPARSGLLAELDNVDQPVGPQVIEPALQVQGGAGGQRHDRTTVPFGAEVQSDETVLTGYARSASPAVRP